METQATVDKSGDFSQAQGSALFPQIEGYIAASSQERMDEALAALVEKKDEWLLVDIDERIAILDEITQDAKLVEEEWVRLSIEEKGFEKDAYNQAAEIVAYGALFRYIRRIRQALVDIQVHQSPQFPGPVKTRPDGQVTVGVFPQKWQDRLLFPNYSLEVWMEPGIEVDEVREKQAAAYRSKGQKGEVVLVLGAGNTSLLPLTDFMHKLFVDNKVVLLKPNPVNEYMGPLMEIAFQSLIRRGFLQIVYGGVEAGSYLVEHALTDEIHLTGSDKTFEAIVYGAGARGEKRKANKKPVISKKFAAELGNVSPVIVVPGPWSDDEIHYKAAHLATMVVANAGSFCTTPRVIVQHKSWDRREAFRNEIGEVLGNYPTTRAYYPGAFERHADIVEAHPQALHYGEPEEGHLPWTLIPDLDPEQKDDVSFSKESFCSLFAETALEAGSVVEYIEKAVDFANETLWGNLSVSIFVHPKSMKDPDIAAAVDRAIAKLRYRTVAINDYGSLAYLMFMSPWGGYPGNEQHDIQSGSDVTNNPLMFSHPQKSVLYSPFQLRPSPLSIISKDVVRVAKKFAKADMYPTVGNMLSFVWTAIQG
jgi:acyl-CoA reductase-like NAD-dependent aldehyde dehydrogenase